MRIIRDDKLATFTLIPVEPEEETIINSIIENLRIGDKLIYSGRRDCGTNNEFCMLYFNKAGGTPTLWGSQENDKHEVNNIRDICFFGSGGLILLSVTEVEGRQAIITTASHCKKCGGNMINLVACEWGICDACSTKCEHQYEHGLVHGAGLDAGVGDFCGLCGRGKPKTEDEPKKSQLQHHLAVERELGIKVIYKNTSLTPSGIASLQGVTA